MSKVNNLTTSFIKITNALDKVKNQDEYTIYVSMLDEEELECLKYAQRLRTYNNREAATATPTPTTDTDESKPETKKRGRKNKVVQGEVIDVDMEVNGSEVLRPFPVFRVFALSLISILLLYGEKDAISSRTARSECSSGPCVFCVRVPPLVAQPDTSTAGLAVPHFAGVYLRRFRMVVLPSLPL